jgi:hypothetical protein
MKAQHRQLAILMASMMATWALAADGDSSAQASTARGGTAAASAHYQGDVGFARTTTRTGSINLARGVALGVDEHGIALSVSTAIAPRRGPAVATNFNVSLGRDGHSSASFGTALASGPAQRSVQASGATSSRRGGQSLSLAGGRAPGGTVQAKAHSVERPPLRKVVRPVIRPAPRPLPRILVRR